MTGLPFADLATKVRAACPEVTVEQSENGQPFLRVPASAVLAVATLLRRDAALQFDALMDLTGYDRLEYPAGPSPAAPPNDSIAVVYLLWSYALRHRVMLEVLAPRAECTVPTVSGVWPAAIYFEREVWDLFGVQFAGHPSLHRIMCPDDWVGHPLRKDYLYPAEYHGVSHLREGQHFEGAPRRVGDAEPEPKAPAKGSHA